MTETLLDSPTARTYDVPSRRNLLRKPPNLGLAIMRLHMMLDADNKADLERAQTLPERNLRRLKQAAGLALRFYLNSKAIQIPDFNSGSDE